MTAPRSLASGADPAGTVKLDEAATIGAALAALTQALRAGGIETPGLDARRLVSHLLDLDGASLLTAADRPLAADGGRSLVNALHRRLAHEPVSRICGVRGFHGLDLAIGPATLDPRPDTETLVDGVLGLVAAGEVPGGTACRFLDLGTGSGAILLALLAALPAAVGLGVDVCPAALAIARSNGLRHGLGARLRWQQGRWLEGVDGSYDVVVSNPPYIATRDIDGLAPDVSRFDPRMALDGGHDGLDAYRAIAADVGRVLGPGAWLAVEVGSGQADAVAALFRGALTGRSGARCDIRCWSDLGGTARCVALRLRS